MSPGASDGVRARQPRHDDVINKRWSADKETAKGRAGPDLACARAQEGNWSPFVTRLLSWVSLGPGQTLATLMWRVPLQVMRLGTFFTRLVLYVLLLLAPLCSMFGWWLFAGKDIISVRWKDGGGLRHTCDIYLPASSAEARAKGQRPAPTAPVIVMIAGGAYAIGHKAYGALLLRALRRAGFLCISIDYRYWPQVGIDGMVEDNDVAVGWAFENVAKYGGDPKRIVLIGHSSGAHIGALLLARRAMLAEDPGGSTPSWRSERILGFVGLAGIYNVNASFMAQLHQKGIDYFLQHLLYGDTEEVRQSRSPECLVRKNPEIAKRMPPMLLVHHAGDKIVPSDQSQTFREAMAEAGGDVHFVLHEGGGHNDPVIHSPLMSDSVIIREIIINAWRWEDTLKVSASPSSTPRTPCCEAIGTPKCCRGWEDEAEKACKETLSALPSWPRWPRPLIEAARHLTPF